jgi:hypothetical protein
LTRSRSDAKPFRPKPFRQANYAALHASVYIFAICSLESVMRESESKPPSAARLPWDFHPALTDDRLRLCARLLANARRDALALAAYEMGDDFWSVGCRAYAFGRHRLKRIAESREHPWLRVMDDSHHFVFLIEQVPVRFYRGAADEPTLRTLRRHEAESQQLGLALGMDEADGLVFRLAVETNATGGVERVVFLALRGEEGRAECVWPITLDVPQQRDKPGVQLRLIADDGYEGPKRPDHRVAARTHGPDDDRRQPPRRRAG